MRYSFVIIAYNEENNISPCIESILAQKLIGESYEIIVVDDGSTDKTARIVKQYCDKNPRIKLIMQKNKGRGAARATGMREVKGKIIANIDGDIILPKTWLITCLKYLKNYDAIGATPVPDGDVAYIYQRYKLKPRVIASSTKISGSNGLYKSKLFSNMGFDPSLKHGYDADFSNRLEAAGYKLKRLNDFTVLHNGNKSYISSLLWLYKYGLGASKNLIHFRKIRLPDVAYLGFILYAIICLLLAGVFRNWFLAILILVYPLFTGFFHIYSRFIFKGSSRTNYIKAIFTDYLLIIMYYIGRTVGILNVKK